MTDAVAVLDTLFSTVSGGADGSHNTRLDRWLDTEFAAALQRGGVHDTLGWTRIRGEVIARSAQTASGPRVPVYRFCIRGTCIQTGISRCVWSIGEATICPGARAGIEVKYAVGGHRTRKAILLVAGCKKDSGKQKRNQQHESHVYASFGIC